MNKSEHYNRSYEEGDSVNIKCKFIEEIKTGYRSIGIRREDLKLMVSDKLKKDNRTETNCWYEISGTVVSEKNYDLEIDVNSIEYIGDLVNDWIFDYFDNNIFNSMSNSELTNKTISATSDSKTMIDSKNHLRSNSVSMSSSSFSMEESKEMSGFSTGGGKNIENFRHNISNNKLPDIKSISHEGVLYQYEFDIGSRNKDSLFYPNYEQSIIKDPITDEAERYLTIGLDSGLDNFERPPLDLMFVIDISGSMDSPMSQYYYDNSRSKDPKEKTKMEATKDVITNIIKKLDSGDRFGITLYNNKGMMAKPLRSVSDVNIDEIVSEINDISSSGGTNLSDGFKTAVDEMSHYSDPENSERESRVMFLTDAMPNTGETSRSELEKQFTSAAESGIYTTFIGVGIDTNPSLIDTLSSIKGANHYFVKSVDEFNNKIRDEFSYTVTPLVFDLKLTVEGDGFEINGVYGSPNENSDSTGSVMDVKTLFPSHGDEGTKGGIIVVCMNNASVGDEVRISTSWIERDGTKGGDVTRIKIKDVKPDYYESNDTLKAVLLCKYVNTISTILDDTNNNDLDNYETESKEIRLSKNNHKKLNLFLDFFSDMLNEMNDDELEKERKVIKKILDAD